MQVMRENAVYKKLMTVININAGWRKKTRFWRQKLVFLGKMAMLSVFVTIYSLKLNESYKGSQRVRKSSKG
jgi:hypothetical protein